MNNHRAVGLPIGARIRRKDAAAEVYVVERVERTASRYGPEVIVHAGGQAFRAWEIERADPRPDWPKGPRTTTSKYDHLGDRLAAIGAAEIVLTFAEVEVIVGPLPKAARRGAAWWAPLPGGQFRHALDWRRRGYVADVPDFAAETVTFRRIMP